MQILADTGGKEKETGKKGRGKKEHFRNPTPPPENFLLHRGKKEKEKTGGGIIPSPSPECEKQPNLEKGERKGGNG